MITNKSILAGEEIRKTLEKPEIIRKQKLLIFIYHNMLSNTTHHKLQYLSGNNFK